jgi:hypothetical protein
MERPTKTSGAAAPSGPTAPGGQHTDEVLSGILGYDRATLAELRGAKVIG